MRIIFTDLDGTLLHPHTYSCEAAEPALRLIREQNVPLVFCTSKTRTEVEFWRDRLENRDPFIVENGGAIFIPSGYFPFEIPGAVERDGYDVIELGTPYAELVEALRSCAQESGCEAVGFADWSVAELCTRTGLPVKQAEMAKEREYDEPFEIVGSGTYRLLGAIEAKGMKWTRGDRFYHILGDNDKAEAVRRLTALYEQASGMVTTVGVGDGHNDAGFLATVNIPIIVQSRFASALARAVPHSIVSRWPGPHGWNETVLHVMTAAAAAGSARA
jgi:mannosyl-3-phosphoglycerate phosphatase